MDVNALGSMLDDLRRTRDDHHTVEAKLARDGLPETLWESISAMCNANGGIIVLGIDETDKKFTVAGVADPGMLTNAIRQTCDELEPSPRPVITTVHHPDGEVVVVELSPTPRHLRPCHRRTLGADRGSYLRVGDADVQLTAAQVDELQAAASVHDYSRAPAPSGSRLDSAAVELFAGDIRAQPGEAQLTTEQVCERMNIVRDGTPTLAGVLLLGENPEGVLAAAEIVVKREPQDGDPPDAQFSTTRVSGTVGHLLDSVISTVKANLRSVTVSRGGSLEDLPDVPEEAIRELVSNALLHRSFSPAMVTRQVRVEINEGAVTVISPGGLHVGVDPARLGLDSVPPTRNHALVRIAERLKTPSGKRIIEHIASGIPRADLACRRDGAMPTLFTDHPTEFRATLLRGAVPLRAAEAALAGTSLAGDPDAVRLVAVLLRLERLRGDAVGHELARQPFDARMAARTLAPLSEEDATTKLAALEQAGILRRRSLYTARTWELVPDLPVAGESSPAPSGGAEPTPIAPAPAPSAAGGGGRKGRAALRQKLLEALLSAPGHELRPKDIAEKLNIGSFQTRTRLLTDAHEAGLIEPTKDNPHNSQQTYRLTRSGLAAAKAQTEAVAGVTNAIDVRP